MNKPRLLLAALALSAAVAATTSCYPVPTWGPGSPNYSCENHERSLWFSERPVNARYAKYTLGMTVCTMYHSTILSATPYQGFDGMGAYEWMMHAGVDGGNLRIDHLTATTVEVEGGSYGQLCAATKWAGFTCSFNDHVHAFLYYTVPPAIGLNGLYYSVDRGDISVWWTP